MDSDPAKITKNLISKQNLFSVKKLDRVQAIQ